MYILKKNLLGEERFANIHLRKKTQVDTLVPSFAGRTKLVSFPIIHWCVIKISIDNPLPPSIIYHVAFCMSEATGIWLIIYITKHDCL